VKLPIAVLAEVVAAANRGRVEEDRVILCVDGVHGLGVERESPAELGCDFFVAGCHKWMFGPRGTGVVWGKPAAWKGHVPAIAAFEQAPYMAWMKGVPPSAPGGIMASPGGFHSFEHRWALGEAFAFHERIGRARITERIHTLARQCKEGLARMSHVTVRTPTDASLSAALVCFEVKGLGPHEVVKRLHARKIIASVTPYATEYARFSPGILNTPEEIETVLREVRALAS
jgi:selenocysteine lyase/cysteine desulfurase